MKSVLKWCAVVALFAIPLSGAKAAFIDVNVAGWNTFGGYALPGGVNSGASINIGAGSTVTSVEYFDITYTALGGSWGSELVLSVNDDNGLGDWLDWKPDDSLGADGPGLYGPYSGVFGVTAPGAPGPFGLGTLSTSATGNLWVTVYESFNDGGNAVQDASISGGIIRINYTPVPEPTSAALALCGLGLCVVRRRCQV